MKAEGLTRELVVEANLDPSPTPPYSGRPPLSALNCWLFRVKLSSGGAVVAYRSNCTDHKGIICISLDCKTSGYFVDGAERSIVRDVTGEGRRLEIQEAVKTLVATMELAGVEGMKF